MRNYRDIGKTGISFLTAFASGHTLDQDATGEGFLFHPGIYINTLQPYNSLLNVSNVIPNTLIKVNYEIEPDIIVKCLDYLSKYFIITENYSSNQNILVNQFLGNTKYNYEVFLNENS